MRLSSAVRLQHERERELSLIVGCQGVPAHVSEVPMGVGGDLRRSLEQLYPVTLPTWDSRGVSLANLILSTKTATARAASVVSRPTMMFLVNPSAM
jgi:hypothetical protein